MEFINYNKCSTCKKAKDFLDSNKIKYVDRQIKENNPSYDEIKMWIDRYSIDVKKLFNTSGLLYRNMNLKDKINNMTRDEMISLLSTDGMLVKRPILVCDDRIIIGFKLKEYSALPLDKC